jgi:hypothetical protein
VLVPVELIEIILRSQSDRDSSSLPEITAHG